MNILITNDDGKKSRGTYDLINYLITCGYDVFTFVPWKDQSGIGSAVSINKKIVYIMKKNRYYLVKGTPVDCILLGTQILNEKNIHIDCIISGINRGVNIGESKKYSGTVNACVESISRNIPAIAISCKENIYDKGKYELYFQILEEIISIYLSLAKDKDLVGINLNLWNTIIPLALVEEVEITDKENSVLKFFDLKGKGIVKINLDLKPILTNASIIIGLLSNNKDLRIVKKIIDNFNEN